MQCHLQCLALFKALCFFPLHGPCELEMSHEQETFWFAERRIVKTNISRWINILHTEPASHSVKRSVKIPILWPIMLHERDLIHNISRVYQMIIGYTHKLCGYYTNSNGEAAALLQCCKTRSPALLRRCFENTEPHCQKCAHYTKWWACILLSHGNSFFFLQKWQNHSNVMKYEHKPTLCV